jgi:hypothetical protein
LQSLDRALLTGSKNNVNDDNVGGNDVDGMVNVGHDYGKFPKFRE